MTRLALTPEERALAVLLAELALEEARQPAGLRAYPFNQFAAGDFERCRSLIDKLNDEDPQPYEPGAESAAGDTYTPPGGRL
jgi:hypothetical protein